MINTTSGMLLNIGGGQFVPGNSKLLSGTLFTPYEVLVIDSKLDDGMPRTGNVWNLVNLTGGIKNDWLSTDEFQIPKVVKQIPAERGST